MEFLKKLESVLEIEIHKILWDSKLQTDPPFLLVNE